MTSFHPRHDNSTSSEQSPMNKTSLTSVPIGVFRAGLTLVEIMIALTMTLVVLGAMMTAFQFASEQMQMGRGVMEMANRLRSGEELLRSDLANLTVDPRPYTETTNPNGYFEIVEGPHRDLNFPLTAQDTVAPAGQWDFDGFGTHLIRDTNSNSVPDPIDAQLTGGPDVNMDNIDDDFDPNFAGNSFRGDHDDIWMGTVRAKGQPFRGRYIPPDTTAPIVTVPSTTEATIDFPNFSINEINVIESPLAEIIWWSDYQDTNSNYIADFQSESVTVYRRVRLIRPDLTLPAFQTQTLAMQYLATTDISARIVIVNQTAPAVTYFQVVANDIKDLTIRENRFCHHPIVGTSAGFPQFLNRGTLWGLRSADYVVGATSVNIEPNGNDILLTDVAAFDLKVYSPNASIGVTDGVTVEPHDIGYVSIPAANKAPIGGYVDLGHSGGGWFGGLATSRSRLTYQFRFDLPAAPQLTGLMDTVYDTWTPHYESDGIDQDAFLGDTTGFDQGTNGVNDVGAIENPVSHAIETGTPAPDDDAERETRPPYPFPIRGIKATIRLVEPNTKQIHQSSVIHSYVPE